MAWITPVTDRIGGEVCTATDMNRISGNIDFLATELTAHQLYTGATVQKTTYTLEYVTVDDWEDILSVLGSLTDALALENAGSADMSTTYTNFNTVESITLRIYERYEMLLSQANNNHYSGDDIYPQDDMSIYSAGLAV